MNYFNYYICQERIITKYRIEFSKVQLEKLRLEIINNCSEVTHRCYEGTTGPDISDNLRIRNFRETKTGRRAEIKRGSNQMTDICYFCYDEFEFPYLVTLIDHLLDGNKEAIEQIINPDYSLEKPTIEERIEKLEKEVSAMSNLNAQKKIIKLNELKTLLEKAEINTFSKPVIPYYQKVKDLLKIETIDSISIDELWKIQDFFGTKLNVDIKKPEKKVLTRIKK